VAKIVPTDTNAREPESEHNSARHILDHRPLWQIRHTLKTTLSSKIPLAFHCDSLRFSLLKTGILGCSYLTAGEFGRRYLRSKGTDTVALVIGD